MSATAMPLPLELTKPVLLAGDLNTVFRASLGVSKYDPKTQMCTGGGGGGTTSNQQSNSFSGLVVIDVTVDVQIDDNNIDVL